MDDAVLYGAQRLEAELPELGERELIGLAEENPQPEWDQAVRQPQSVLPHQASAA